MQHPFLKYMPFIFTIILSVASIALVVQYRYFCDQTNKLIEVKEEYRTYLGAVKKILHEYNKMKEQLDGAQNSTELEKKKDDVSKQWLIASNAKLYSTENLLDADFVVVNRDPEYLKQSALDFVRDQKLEAIADHMNSEAWCDYTQHMIQRSKTSSRRQRRRPTKSTVRARTPNKVSSPLPSRVSITKNSEMPLLWPIDHSCFWLSSFFGPRKKPDGSWGFHYGLDMAALKGTPVKAAAGGVVVEASYLRGYGNTVVIAHNHKYKTRYAHLNDICVKIGQKVLRSTMIGHVGDTGMVRSKGKDASHLHFEVELFGKKDNPMHYLI